LVLGIVSVTRAANRAAPNLPTVKLGRDFDSDAATARRGLGNEVADMWLARGDSSTLARCR
jgi:hypothetical protein